MYSDLEEKIGYLSVDEISMVKKAYDVASVLHNGVLRESGEPYITHPLSVACILADMHADADTLCASLLHDTIEDTNITKEEICFEFNPCVANLVDGVTKLAKMNYCNDDSKKDANKRKIIMGITNDVRIIIIKLADRLHNMRTLQYKKKKEKIIENANETLQLFVPLAYYIGAYRIKSELEDLSLQYLKPDEYKRIMDIRNKLDSDNNRVLNEMLLEIQYILNNNEIPNEIKARVKNIYGIYKSMNKGKKISDIHDLLSLKIMVETVNECWLSMGYIHSKYKPINYRFKDYINNPKTNMYSSLHTTVFAPDKRYVQAQIRTFEMDKLASFGLMAYWDVDRKKAYEIMQSKLRSECQFYSSLVEMDNSSLDNREYVRRVDEEILADTIYVYTTSGDVVELAEGSTIVDFAYKLDPKLGDTLSGCYVNEQIEPLNYKLRNKDRVNLITNNLFFGVRNDLIGFANNSSTIDKIKNRQLQSETQPKCKMKSSQNVKQNPAKM